MDNVKLNDVIGKIQDCNMDRLIQIGKLSSHINALKMGVTYRPELYLHAQLHNRIDERNCIIANLETITKIEDALFEELLQLSKEES